MRILFFCILSFCFISQRAQQINAASWLKKGVVALDGNKFEEAVDCFSKAIELNANYDTAYYKRGNARSELKKDKESVEDYSQAIKLNPNYTNAYINRGNSKRKLGLVKESIDDYTKAIELESKSKDAKTFCRRAQAKLTLGLAKEAIEDFEKAIEINPKSFCGYDGKGGALLISEKYSEALTEFNKAIQCDSTKPQGYYDRALVESYLEQNTEALADYSKAIELDPKFGDAYNNRGIISLDARDYDKAISDFESAIKTNSADQKYKDNLELALKKKKINFIPMQAKTPLVIKINSINHIIKGELISSCRMDEKDSVPRNDCYLEITDAGIVYSELEYRGGKGFKPVSIKYSRFFLETKDIKAKSKKSGIIKFSCYSNRPTYLYYLDAPGGLVELKIYKDGESGISDPVPQNAMRILFDSEEKAKEVEKKLKEKK